MPKLTPDRANFLRKRIKKLRREILATFALGIAIAITAGYAAILWESSTNPLGVGFPAAIGDVTGLLVASPFMTALLIFRRRMNAYLDELNPKK